MGTPRQSRASHKAIPLATKAAATSALIARRGEQDAALMLYAANVAASFAVTRKAPLEILPSLRKTRKALQKARPVVANFMSELMATRIDIADGGEHIEVTKKTGDGGQHVFSSWTPALLPLAERFFAFEKTLASFERAITEPRNELMRVLTAHGPKVLSAAFIWNFCEAMGAKTCPPSATDLMQLSVAVGVDRPTEDRQEQSRRLDAWDDVVHRLQPVVEEVWPLTAVILHTMVLPELRDTMPPDRFERVAELVREYAEEAGKDFDGGGENRRSQLKN